MKLVMFEANAEELSSNKRLMDEIVDALGTMVEGSVRGDIAYPLDENDSEDSDDD